MNGSERECPVCGKLFHIGKAKDWAYKVNKTVNRRKHYTLLCSYKCKTKYEEEMQK